MCDKTFTKPSHLKRHLHLHGIISTTDASKTDSVEKERKVVECEFCDRKFVYKKSYTHHMHTEHGMSDDSDDLPLSTYINKPEGKKSDVVETVVEVIENCKYIMNFLFLYSLLLTEKIYTFEYCWVGLRI